MSLDRTPPFLHQPDHALPSTAFLLSSCPSTATGKPPPHQNRAGAPPPPPSSVSVASKHISAGLSFPSPPPSLCGTAGPLRGRRQPLEPTRRHRTPPPGAVTATPLTPRRTVSHRLPTPCSVPPHCSPRAVGED
jgi:hypothetical protein